MENNKKQVKEGIFDAADRFVTKFFNSFTFSIKINFCSKFLF